MVPLNFTLTELLASAPSPLPSKEIALAPSSSAEVSSVPCELASLLAFSVAVSSAWNSVHLSLYILLLLILLDSAGMSHPPDRQAFLTTH